MAKTIEYDVFTWNNYGEIKLFRLWTVGKLFGLVSAQVSWGHGHKDSRPKPFLRNQVGAKTLPSDLESKTMTCGKGLDETKSKTFISRTWVISRTQDWIYLKSHHITLIMHITKCLCIGIVTMLQENRTNYGFKARRNVLKTWNVHQPEHPLPQDFILTLSTKFGSICHRLADI